MGFPKINIIFKSTATASIAQGNGGVVALMLKDAVAQKGNYQMASVADIPAGLSAANKNFIQLAFMGGVKAPRKVIAIVKDTAVTDWVDTMTTLETYKWNFLACPEADASANTAIVSWVKSMRDTKGRKVKFVVANTAGDSEGVINFATDGIVVGGTTYTAAQYTARIAGILAGTPSSDSVTFFRMSEVTDLSTHISEDAAGTAVDAGKLVLFHDGEKVKIVRGVNSLQTLTADKGAEFKKIKIVDILDQINDDIKRTAEDSYIGRVPNSYENKLLLINAINGYFEALEQAEILEKGKSKCEIDLNAQKSYLKGIGYDVAAMTDSEVKSANTSDKVFLKASVKPLDSMEDITFNVSL